MTPNEYQVLAMKTEADQQTVLERFHSWSPNDQLLFIELNNGITGLSDEVGELNAALKKWIEYGKPLDKVNIKEEVGDALWRLSQICNALEITLEDCMSGNLQKLKSRYPNLYSDERAAEENRDREAEREAVQTKDSEQPGVFGVECPDCQDKSDHWHCLRCDGERRLFTPKELCEEFDLEIIDANGWKGEWERPFSEPVSIREFVNRFGESTILLNWSKRFKQTFDEHYDPANFLEEYNYQHPKSPELEPETDTTVPIVQDFFQDFGSVDICVSVAGELKIAPSGPTQNGCGWAEYPEDCEWKEPEILDEEPGMKIVSPSYSRACSQCGRPIHRSNSVGYCANCAATSRKG